MGDAPEGNLGRTFAILVIMAFVIPFMIAMSGPILNGTSSEEQMKNLPGFSLEDMTTNSFWAIDGLQQGRNSTDIAEGSYWVPLDYWMSQSNAYRYSTDSEEMLFEEPPGMSPDVRVHIIHHEGNPTSQYEWLRYSDFLVISQQWGIWDFKYVIFDMAQVATDYSREKGGVILHAQLAEKMTVWIKAESAQAIEDGEYTVFVGQSLTDQAQGSNDVFGMLASAITLSWSTGDSMLDWLIKLPLIFAYVYVAFRLIAMLIPFT
jgi:hypothetical protein